MSRLLRNASRSVAALTLQTMGMVRTRFARKLGTAAAATVLAFVLSSSAVLAADDGSLQYDPSGVPHAGGQGGAQPSAVPAPAPGGVTRPGHPLPGPANAQAPPTDGGRQNPLPQSPSAPALITVNPWAIDPGVENTLNLFGRNLSAKTTIKIGGIAAQVPDPPDEWHLLVHIPANLLSEGRHNVVLTNADGQVDEAIG